MTSTDTIKVDILVTTQAAVAGINSFAEKVATALGPTHALGAAVYGMKTAFGTLQAAMSPYVQIAQTALRVVSDLLNEYAESEKVVSMLSNAFKQQGDYTGIAVEALTGYAGALSRVTAYSDDAITQAMAMLKQLTNLNENGIKALIPSIQDFATGMGLDLVSAATLVAKTIGSSTNAMSRYGIEVDASKSESEKLVAVLDQLQSKFGGLAISVGETTGGKITILKNALGELEETAGAILANSGMMDFLINFITGVAGGGYRPGNVANVAQIQKAAQAQMELNVELERTNKTMNDSGVGRAFREREMAVIANAEADKRWHAALKALEIAIKETNDEYFNTMKQAAKEAEDPKSELELLIEKIAKYAEMARTLKLTAEEYDTLARARKNLYDQVDVLRGGEGGELSYPPTDKSGYQFAWFTPEPEVAEKIEYVTNELRRYKEIMRDVSDVTTKAKTDTYDFNKALVNMGEQMASAALREGISALNKLGEAFGAGTLGNSVSAADIIWDMVEALLNNMATLALGAAINAAIAQQWVAFWILIGIAGVSAIAAGVMTGVQTAASNGTNANDQSLGAPEDMGGALGMANRRGSGPVINVYGSVWNGDDLAVAYGKALMRA